MSAHNSDQSYPQGVGKVGGNYKGVVTGYRSAEPVGSTGQRYWVAEMIPARIRPRPPRSTTFEVSQNTAR